MRIHADKINDGSLHGLSVRDVRSLLAAVPPRWIEGLVEVRLANGPGPQAYLFHSEGRLTIYSRDGTKMQILTKVLSALAAPSLKIVNVVARGPSKAEQRRLDHFIQPTINELWGEMRLPKSEVLKRVHLWQPTLLK